MGAVAFTQQFYSDREDKDDHVNTWSCGKTCSVEKADAVLSVMSTTPDIFCLCCECAKSLGAF